MTVNSLKKTKLSFFWDTLYVADFARFCLISETVSLSAIMEPRDMRLEDLEDVEELRRRVTRAQEQAAKAQNEVERKNEQ